jgi:AcrR family transcriptional regulator/DNA-binding MarR family transcriptional regulator
MGEEGRASSARTAPIEPAPADGLGRESVSEIQRTRMVAAMAEVVGERGATDVAVAHVVERAGVSRRTFYEIFEDREDCFLAALEEAIARAGCCVSAGYDPTAAWEERLRGALEAFLRFLDDEPALGRLAVVESLSAGAKARERRQAVVARIVVEIDAGREGMVAGCPATDLMAEGVVGGVSLVIHDRLLLGDRVRLVELVNPLMSMVVLPYLGPDAARQELTRPVAKASLRGPTPPANPFKGLDMRLTYRTVRVLGAVEANPGCSNRVIGDASGVGDQGQISKLLTRLQKLGLIDNVRAGHSSSATNAWTLTEQGEEVARVVTARSTGT